MAKDKEKAKTKPKNKKQPPPDKRGERPSDPNEFAKWLVEQTTETEVQKEKNQSP